MAIHIEMANQNKNLNLEKEVARLSRELEALKKAYADLKTLLDLERLRNEQLQRENSELRRRLRLDSSNSHKPPSTDEFRKPIKNSRVKSDKPVGGQMGHPGRRLEPVCEPDQLLIHQASTCENCGAELSAVPEETKIRQVFDIPEVPIIITEHRGFLKSCSCCGKKTPPNFPEGVSHPTQYGPRMLAFIAYLRCYQLLPFNRISELILDLTGHKISEGTIENISSRLSSKLDGFEDYVRKELMNSPVIHADETGARSEGKRNWMHVASTSRTSLFSFSEKRGRAAIFEADVLPEYRGVIVHDRYRSYDILDATHAICNAHILRELKFLKEELNCEWAGQISEILIESHSHKKSGTLNPKDFKRYRRKYLQILKHQIKLISASDPEQKKKRKRSREENLLLDMLKREAEILRYLEIPEVPFDNNQAERDLRMIKVQQKISGGFRSNKSGKNFALNRSYVSTLKKNGVPILHGLALGIANRPILGGWGA